jgi:hypothetical protein
MVLSSNFDGTILAFPPFTNKPPSEEFEKDILIGIADGQLRRTRLPPQSETSLSHALSKVFSLAFCFFSSPIPVSFTFFTHASNPYKGALHFARGEQEERERTDTAGEDKEDCLKVQISKEIDNRTVTLRKTVGMDEDTEERRRTSITSNLSLHKTSAPAQSSPHSISPTEGIRIEEG